MGLSSRTIGSKTEETELFIINIISEKENKKYGETLTREPDRTISRDAVDQTWIVCSLALCVIATIV